MNVIYVQDKKMEDFPSFARFQAPINVYLHKFCFCFSLLTGVRTITVVALVLGGGFMFLAFEIGFEEYMCTAISVCCTAIGVIFCFWFLTLLLLQSVKVKVAQKLSTWLAYCLVGGLMFSFFLFIILLYKTLDTDTEYTLTVIATLACFLACFFSLYSVCILKVYFINLEESQHPYSPRERDNFAPASNFEVVREPFVDEFETGKDISKQGSTTSTLSRYLFSDSNLSPRIVERMEKTFSQIRKEEDDSINKSSNFPLSSVPEEEPSYERISVYQRKSPRSTKNSTPSKVNGVVTLYSLNRRSLILPAVSGRSEQNETFHFDRSSDCCDPNPIQERSFSIPEIKSDTVLTKGTQTNNLGN